MSSTIELDDELERRKAEVDANFAKAERLGKAQLERLARGIRALELPRGSYVIIEVDTGEYVTGPSRKEARLAFRARYPKALAWMCPVTSMPTAPSGRG